MPKINLNSNLAVTCWASVLRNCSYFVGFLLATSALAADPAGFGPGEHIAYEVRFLGLSAGIGDLRVGSALQREGREVWPLVCFGETRSLASLYAMHDKFISFWDPATTQNVGSDFFVDEKHKRRRERYRYDRDAAKVFATKQKEGQPAVELEFDIRADALDVAAAGFWLRTVPLSEGAVHERAVFTGAKQFVMHAKVEGRQSVTTPLGTFDVWRVSVNADFKGSLSTRGDIHVYYTADARQLPVRAEADFAIGTIVANVVQYEPGRAPTPGVAR